MCRVQFRVSTVIIGALIASVPLPVSGQAMEISLRSDVRQGAEIRADQLGTFLATRLMIGETEKNLTNPNVRRGATSGGWPVALRVELVGRRSGVVASSESQAVQSVRGVAYEGSRWISRPGGLNEQLFAPLKPAEFVIFRIGQKTLVDTGRPGVPRECEGATHALLITLVSRDERFAREAGSGKTLAVCLTGGT